MTVTGRWLRVTVAVAALAVAFAAGVVTGAFGVADHRKSGSVLDQAESRIEARSAHPVSRSQLERAAVEGMLTALDDKWSAYYSPSAFRRFQDVLDGRYTGVGIWVRRSALGALVVASAPSPDSPAASAGVRKGDEILAVDGRSVAGIPVTDVVGKLRGDAGTTVSLRIRRDGVTRTVSLRRVAINEDDVAMTRVTPSVRMLRIAAFTRGVGRWVWNQVGAAERHHDTGIVLDLRDDPGGLLDEAVDTASAFLSGGPVVSYQQRGAPRRVLDAIGIGDTTIPVVVLVDGGTASAAEIVAAALQDRGRAVLIGSQTFGKGSVQAPSNLSDGSALELTIGRYFTPRGTSLDGVGLQPDVQVAPGSPPSVAEQRAVEVLSGMLADTGSSGRG